MAASMFGHPSQHQHMIAGVQKALASPNTPKHLRPHLEKRMKMFKGKPITAAKPQNSPKAVKQGPGGPAAQSQIMGPPMPFQNAKGAANLAAPKGPQKGIGNGKTANAANVKGKRSGFYGG